MGKDGQTTNAVEHFFGTFQARNERHLSQVRTAAPCALSRRNLNFATTAASGLGVNDRMRAEALLKGVEGKRLDLPDISFKSGIESRPAKRFLAWRKRRASRGLLAFFAVRFPSFISE